MDKEERKAILLDRLKQREDVRKNEIAQKKQDSDNSRDAITSFNTNFIAEKEIIEGKFQLTNTAKQCDLNKIFEDISKSLHVLQKYLNDSAFYLPSYDQKQAQACISQFNQNLNDCMERLQPKKKFAFKSRKKGDATIAAKTEVAAKPATNGATKEAVQIECGVTDKQNETFTLMREEVNGKDVDLARLDNCVVKILGSPSVIHVAKLHNCRVLCGPVGRSVFLSDCTECSFFMAAQQIRIHSTVDTDFYVHVTSKAIVEDCKTVRFAPYSADYAGIEGDYVTSGLDRSVNNWDEVDDFNFLAQGVSSPNWSVLPEGERKVFGD